MGREASGKAIRDKDTKELAAGREANVERPAEEIPGKFSRRSFFRAGRARRFSSLNALGGKEETWRFCRAGSRRKTWVNSLESIMPPGLHSRMRVWR